MKLPNLNCPIIAVANQKGGVGKTTTTVNLPEALRLASSEIQKILIADFDPQGNATQALGVEHETVQISISDLIRDRSVSEQSAIYKTSSVDLIPATKLLAHVQLEMIGAKSTSLFSTRGAKALKFPSTWSHDRSLQNSPVLLRKILKERKAFSSYWSPILR